MIYSCHLPQRYILEEQRREWGIVPAEISSPVAMAR
jgi:hypothetical protein